MELAIIGAGWVGVTTAAAFADIGHTVVCADLNAERITQLNLGEVPFFEPGLSELLQKALASGRLKFTTSNEEAIKAGEIVFCCVNTPTSPDGSTDLNAVTQVARAFAKDHRDGAVFVIKSTVPAGTAATMRRVVAETSQRPFAIGSNPEFLAESTAIRDTMTPSRLVLGADEPETIEKMKHVYEPIIANGARVFTSDCATAEVVKTASNSFLATRISFINEIANYANQVGADPMGVAQGMGMDPRIGAVRPGVGYGGGCFPKDVQALIGEGERAGTPFTVLKAAHTTNYLQRTRLYDRLSAALGGVAGKKITIFGLAFKPKTDDVRDAPAITLIDRLLKEGAQVVAYDPQVKPTIVNEHRGLVMASTALDAAKDADAVVLMCEWQEFQEIDLKSLQQVMKGRVLVDGRYIWSKKVVEALGFTYVV
jgi:UDPglucose 6-dehydrogenase